MGLLTYIILILTINMNNMFVMIALKSCYVLFKFSFFESVLFFVLPTFTEVGQLGDPSNIDFDGNESFTDEAIIIGLVISSALFSVSHPLAPLDVYLSTRQKCFSGTLANNFTI